MPVQLLTAQSEAPDLTSGAVLYDEVLKSEPCDTGKT